MTSGLLAHPESQYIFAICVMHEEFAGTSATLSVVPVTVRVLCQAKAMGDRTLSVWNVAAATVQSHPTKLPWLRTL